MPTPADDRTLAFTPEQIAALRARLPLLAEKVVAAIIEEVPSYSVPFQGRMGRTIEMAVALALDGFLDMAAAVERHLGFGLVACLHLNDSEGALGSRKDRHANIGEGKIGLEGFRRLLSEPRLAGVPAVLETPLGDDEGGHGRDLARLRELLAG